jgi:hypothetical protein
MNAEQAETLRERLARLDKMRSRAREIVRQAQGPEAQAIAHDCEQLVSMLVQAMKDVVLMQLEARDQR